MEQAYVLGGLRSHIGICGQTFCHIPAEDLGAAVLKKLMEAYGISHKDLDFVICGNGVGGGGNIGRLTSLTAGIAESVPAVTIDLQCGSALESISIAAAKIQSGQADLIIAGGCESSSTQPRRAFSPNHPDYQGEQFYTAAKFMPKVHRSTAMLEGAELTAVRENIERDELDAWALVSHQRALAARDDGALSPYLLSVNGSVRDEGIRERMSERLLKRLPYLLENGSRITAGNACLTHDGAAFVVLCSEAYIKKNRSVPCARILKTVSVGGDPMESPRTAVSSIEKLLLKTSLQAQFISCFEVNEPFAVIDVLFDRKFPGCRERYNIFGGALAYGHPYGASGAIIFLHLLAALSRQNGRYGVCSIAAAGGIGTAMLIEKI